MPTVRRGGVNHRSSLKLKLTPKCVLRYYAAFYQGLHRLLRQKQYSVNEIQFYIGIIIFDLSTYTMDHPEFVM